MANHPFVEQLNGRIKSTRAARAQAELLRDPETAAKAREKHSVNLRRAQEALAFFDLAVKNAPKRAEKLDAEIARLERLKAKAATSHDVAALLQMAEQIKQGEKALDDEVRKSAPKS